MAFDAFLKIDGIDGESQDAKHKSEIQVLSWSFGDASNATAATRGGATRNNLSFSFVKLVDKASPLLLERTCAGQSIASATLSARKVSADGVAMEDFLKLTMSNVIITSVVEGGNTQTDGAPLDQVNMSFLKWTMALTPDVGGDAVTASCGSFIKG